MRDARSCSASGPKDRRDSRILAWACLVMESGQANAGTVPVPEITDHSGECGARPTVMAHVCTTAARAGHRIGDEARQGSERAPDLTAALSAPSAPMG